MTTTLDFILDRTVKTIAAARGVAGRWTWAEKTPDQLQQQLAAIVGEPLAKPPVEGQQQRAQAAEQAMLAARGEWDTALDRLHLWTMQGVALAKTRFRAEPAKAAQLAALEVGADSRRGTLSEAGAWQAAWTALEAAWAPLPDLTLPAYTLLRENCEGPLQSTYLQARANWRKEVEQRQVQARALEDVVQAWYADATRVFPAGTPEGDMIRGTVPTKYVRSEEGSEDDETGTPAPAPAVAAQS